LRLLGFVELHIVHGALAIEGRKAASFVRVALELRPKAIPSESGEAFHVADGNRCLFVLWRVVLIKFAHLIVYLYDYIIHLLVII